MEVDAVDKNKNDAQNFCMRDKPIPTERSFFEEGCLQAERFGLQGRPAEAHVWHMAMIALLNNSPCNAPERARLCRSLGLQRGREGRKDEALALLGRTAEIFAEHGKTGDAAEAQVEIAWIYYDAIEVERAFFRFEEALKRLPVEEWPAPRLRGLAGLALAAEDLGRPREADAALAEGAVLAPEVALVPHRQQFELVRARIAELRGQTREMIEILEQLFSTLRKGGCPYEATMVGLDLARILHGEGWPSDGVISSLPRLSSEANSAVRAAWERIERKDPDAESILRQIQEDLGYAKHNPEHRFSLPPGAAEATGGAGAAGPR